MPFFGHKRHKIDSRSRTSLPAEFREELIRMDESRLVMARNFDGDEFRYLVVYPKREWEKISKMFNEVNQFDPDALRVKRYFLAYGEPCSLDNLGRILVSPELRQFAGFRETVIWRGMVNYVELWDEETWLRAETKGNQAEVMASLGRVGRSAEGCASAERKPAGG